MWCAKLLMQQLGGRSVFTAREQQDIAASWVCAA
jgi:hypothetical protein